MTTADVEHVVLVMLENRSFDSLLGWLYESDAPAMNIPPAAAGDEFRGLAHLDLAAFTNNAPSVGLSSTPKRGTAGFTVPTPDPGEEFEHVNVQFFGTKTPAPQAQATMTGVLADYVDVMTELKYEPADVRGRAATIMQTYTPAQLPILNQLAKHYAVSDAWFASVPSQTNPNRAFTMCGTSHGLVNNGELEDNAIAKKIESTVGLKIGDDRFPEKTIFNALQDCGKDWKVFWQTSYLPEKISALLDAANAGALLGPIVVTALMALEPYTRYLKELSSGSLSSSYTWRLFPRIQDIPNAASHFAKIDEFFRLARAGQLPAFSYIEPFWTISQGGTDDSWKKLIEAIGNDYHPPANLLVSEDFVKDVYTSLISNREAWSKTLLIITFDEFVGSFDHVEPPAAVAPWGPNGSPPYQSPTGFKFDRLGARVPTILVSPYVQRASVFRSTTDVAYDHTSILATTLNWLGAGTQVASFGQRTAQAPTFDNVLVLDDPRTDERDLAFLETARDVGEPLRFADPFTLRWSDGRYIASFRMEGKSSVISDLLTDFALDLGLSANFPTLGDATARATLMLLNTNPDVAAVNDGDDVLLVSRERGLGANNVLGAWPDSHDCYYYDLYLDGTNRVKQTWTIQKVDNPDGPVLFGDRVYLVSRGFSGQRLTMDDRLGQSGWLTTSANGGAWTIEPLHPRTPKLKAVAAARQGGSRGVQLWAADTQDMLRSTYEETAGGNWSPWSQRWADAPPDVLWLTAAQQTDGRVQLWVVDDKDTLYSNYQTSPGGGWYGWSASDWNGAPKLTAIATATQGGSRGVQLWGIDIDGILHSTYQPAAGGGWVPWWGPWTTDTPTNLVWLTAAQERTGPVQLWAVDESHTLYCNYQTSPGGGWNGWSSGNWNGAPKLTAIAACGTTVDTQLWGVDESGRLRSTYMLSVGDGWSPWSDQWTPDSPANVIALAAVQHNDGRAQIWAIDQDNILHTNCQTSSGGWQGWSS